MSGVDYVLNVMLTILAAFMLLVAAMLVWIVHLLERVATLERNLKRAASWHASWMGYTKRQERTPR